MKNFLNNVKHFLNNLKHFFESDLFLVVLSPMAMTFFGIIIGRPFKIWNENNLHYLFIFITILMIISILLMILLLRRITNKSKQFNDDHKRIIKEIKDDHDKIIKEIGTSAQFLYVHNKEIEGNKNTTENMFKFYKEIVQDAKKEIFILQYRPSWKDDDSPAVIARQNYYDCLKNLICKHDKSDFQYTRIIQMEEDENNTLIKAQHDKICKNHLDEMIEKFKDKVTIQKACVSIGATIIVIDQQHIFIELPSKEDFSLLGVFYIKDTQNNLYPNSLKGFLNYAKKNISDILNTDEIYLPKNTKKEDNKTYSVSNETDLTCDTE